MKVTNNYSYYFNLTNSKLGEKKTGGEEWGQRDSHNHHEKMQSRKRQIEVEKREKR